MTGADPRLVALYLRYHGLLESKREDIESAWRAVCADHSDVQSRATLSTLIHRLAGSAASYGYAGVGKAAAAVDALLDRFPEKEGAEERERAMFSLLNSIAPVMDKLLESMRCAADHPPGPGQL